MIDTLKPRRRTNKNNGYHVKKKEIYREKNTPYPQPQ